MPPITLNYYVTQGTYGITANTNVTFGTGGAATCVGILATLNNGQNFCGHLDSAYEPKPAQRDFYRQQVRTLFQNTIPAANVTNIYYTTGGTTPAGTTSSDLAVAVLVELFPAAQSLGDNTNIYTENGTVVQASNAQYINGDNQVNNGLFTIPMPIDFYVAPGTYGVTLATNLVFGVQGLGTHVGILARLNTGNNFCGYLTSAYEPTSEQEEAYKGQVIELLNSVLPAESITTLYYVITGANASSTYAVEALEANYNPRIAQPATNKGANGALYIDMYNVKASNDVFVNGPTQVNNGPFTIAAP